MLLFSPFDLGPLHLANRVVMAPMTRSRAIGNVPNQLMTAYYRQRASSGLIVTEGTAPSPNGVGYARIPGLYTAEQTKAWREIADAVHQAGGRIAAQLMHVGRIGHPLNLPPNAELIAPSAVAANGVMFTDQKGLQPFLAPRAMTAADIEQTRDEFAAAAKNAISAGMDAVELHAANGYLLEQFLNPHTNRRDDLYGGSIAARARFVVETTEAVAQAIGANRVGIRLSPHNRFNDMPAYEETVEQYVCLADRLSRIGVLYVHLILGTKRIPNATVAAVRQAYRGPLMVNSGFNRESAEAVLRAGDADLVSFGAPFIANPDLVDRMREDWPLAEPIADQFYTPGPKGYVDYPPRDQEGAPAALNAALATT